MIRLTDALPPYAPDYCFCKLFCMRECYPDLTLLWEQDGGQALFGMLDGDLVVAGTVEETEEFEQFLRMISPHRVFAPAAVTLPAPWQGEELTVLRRQREDFPVPPSDRCGSREIYDLLSVDGLTLPPYDAFAVDFCRRLNHGWADYYALRGKCAAVLQHCGSCSLLTGIASHVRGFGTTALRGILSAGHGTVLVCCRPELCGFYEKNGFVPTERVREWKRTT